mmetsp:Transcript_113289/g.178199  ORF Transcript_113289/g.178199 Transcript_113289/m.178199 type:complete len:261 (+) Transcript_113289:302-1084(+)
MVLQEMELGKGIQEVSHHGIRDLRTFHPDSFPLKYKQQHIHDDKYDCHECDDHRDDHKPTESVSCRITGVFGTHCCEEHNEEKCSRQNSISPISYDVSPRLDHECGKEYRGEDDCQKQHLSYAFRGDNAYHAHQQVTNQHHSTKEEVCRVPSLENELETFAESFTLMVSTWPQDNDVQICTNSTAYEDGYRDNSKWQQWRHVVTHALKTVIACHSVLSTRVGTALEDCQNALKHSHRQTSKDQAKRIDDIIKCHGICRLA